MDEEIGSGSEGRRDDDCDKQKRGPLSEEEFVGDEEEGTYTNALIYECRPYWIPTILSAFVGYSGVSAALLLLDSFPDFPFRAMLLF